MKRHCLSTMYGVGLVRFAPGTYGSFVAALLAYPILLLPNGYLWLTAGAALFTLLGTANASRFMRDRNTSHDPKEIVIDELIGQWFTFSVWYGLMALTHGAIPESIGLLAKTVPTPLLLLVGFVLFRVFDILKPWPIRWADRHIKGGFGVMFDDILAAIPAGGLLYAAQVYGIV